MKSVSTTAFMAASFVGLCAAASARPTVVVTNPSGLLTTAGSRAPRRGMR